MKEVEVPPSSVSVGQGYVLHGVDECREIHCVRFHS